MASIPVVINGATGTGEPITIVGTMAYADRGVGGGPIVPPDKPPIDPGLHPEHPIYWPPGTQPHPEHPIVLPPPVDPPTEPPANPQLVWGYSPQVQRWVQVYVPGEGEASPK